MERTEIVTKDYLYLLNLDCDIFYTKIVYFVFAI